MSSLSALIVRDMAFKSRDPNKAFFTGTQCYEGGYFMPYKLKADEQMNILQEIHSKISQLNILAEWGIPDICDSKILHVFTAAPSYQDQPPPPIQSPGQKLCTLLVEAQYRTIAQIAVLRSAEIQTRVPPHLTLVGQGVFNNPPSVIKSAFQAVYDTVNGFDVDVYFHGYGDADMGKVKGNLPTALGKIPILYAATFFA
jgi:hypothetical protein